MFPGVLVVFLVNQSFIGAVRHTGRDFFTLAKVAFYYFVAMNVLAYCPVGTDQNTCPAAHAFAFIYYNRISPWLSVQRPGKAGINARGVLAVLAAYRKGNDAVLFQTNARDRRRFLFIKCLFQERSGSNFG